MSGITTLRPGGDFLAVESLTIHSPAGRPIVQDLTFGVGPGARLAIIGVEGVGKTSLVKCLAGEPMDGFAVSGTVARSDVGYLPQTLPREWLPVSVRNYLASRSAKQVSPLSGWEDYGEIVSALLQVGLTESVAERPLHSLSGGEQVRAQFAKLLFERRQVLVLDEPTNYLDLWTIEWLQQFLVTLPGPICFVSHDELLLSSVANRICYLQYVAFRNEVRHEHYQATYEEFLQIRQDRIDREHQSVTAQAARLKRLARRLSELRTKAESRAARAKPQDAAESMRMRRGHANAVQRIGQLAGRMEKEVRLQDPVEDMEIKVDFPSSSSVPNAKVVLNLDIPQLFAGDKLLAEHVAFSIVGPEKLVIVGRNGSGKSTLLRKLAVQLEHVVGITAHLVPQRADELFPNDTELALTYLKRFTENLTFVRTLMARMQFEDSEVESRISELSGGQRVKLALLGAILNGANVLLLDEPTTNLSPLSLPELRAAMRAFPGALVVVSHDRLLIDEVADRVLLLDGGRLMEIRKDGLGVG